MLINSCVKWDNLLNLCPPLWNRVPHSYSLNQPQLCLTHVLNARDLKTRSPFSCSVDSNEGRQVTKKSIKRKAVLESGRCRETNKMRTKDHGNMWEGIAGSEHSQCVGPEQQGAQAFSREKAREAVAQWASGSWWESGRKYSRRPSGNWGRDKQAYKNPALIGCQEDEMRTDPLITALSKTGGEDSPGVQWLRTGLPMLGAWVWSLDWEDSMYLRATKPVCHSYWAGLLLEPLLGNKRSHCREKPDLGNWRAAPALQDRRKPGHSNKGTAQPEIK